jgi:DNA-binding transcriptional MerR regulator
MATAAARPQPVEIPNKLYFRIGDVTRLTGIKAYVLRYWETEFPMLSPRKSGANQRLYRRKDVETVLQIKHLLYERRFTIEGAKSFLQRKNRDPKPVAVPAAAAAQSSLFPAAASPDRQSIQLIRKELLEVLALLK